MSKDQEPLSPLEQKLEAIPALDPSAEHEIDKLRLVLQGQLGTPAQRSMLLRIIKSTKLPAGHKNLTMVLAEKLGDAKTQHLATNRHSYITCLSPTQQRLRQERRNRERERMKQKTKEQRAFARQQHREIVAAAQAARAQRAALRAAAEATTRTAIHDELVIDPPPPPTATRTGAINLGDIIRVRGNLETARITDRGTTVVAPPPTAGFDVAAGGTGETRPF